MVSEPYINVSLEIKKSDGNYGTRTINAMACQVPLNPTAEQLASITATIDMTVEALKAEVARKFKNGGD